jgi:hypothetical protein
MMAAMIPSPSSAYHPTYPQTVEPAKMQSLFTGPAWAGAGAMAIF